MEMMIACTECGELFAAEGGRGPTPRFCSPRCRVRAHRARKRAAAPRLPAAMMAVDRWVRADGKRPIMADGSPASSTNPTTWSSFADVQHGAGDGMMFACGDGFGVLDLDKCISEDGSLSPLAERILALNPDAFVEKSQSGKGLHVWGKISPRRGSRRNGLEVYSFGRVVRMGTVYRNGGLPSLLF